WLRIQIIDAQDVIACGGQKGNGWPAALVVAQINIRVLRLLNADGHEEGIEERDDLIVRQGRVVHALAIATPEGCKPQDKRFVLLPRLLERLGTPGPPLDQMWPVGARRKAEHTLAFSHFRQYAARRQRRA